MSKESTATKKAQELNQLAGYKRFTVIRTPLPGRGGATLNDSWSVHDTKTGENYSIGSIYATTALTVLAAQLRKQKVDAVSGASSDKRPKPVRHGDEEFDEDESEDDLNHYGVLGMKWGVRKDPQKAYERANKKLDKLDKKVVKADRKVAKAQERSVKKQARANSAILFPKLKSRGAANSLRRVNQQHLKLQRKAAKAEKWYKAMENAFRDVKMEDLNKNSHYVDLGKKYANHSIDKMMANTVTSAAMLQMLSYYDGAGRR